MPWYHNVRYLPNNARIRETIYRSSLDGMDLRMRWGGEHHRVQEIPAAVVPSVDKSRHSLDRAEQILALSPEPVERSWNFWSWQRKPTHVFKEELCGVLRLEAKFLQLPAREQSKIKMNRSQSCQKFYGDWWHVDKIQELQLFTRVKSNDVGASKKKKGKMWWFTKPPALVESRCVGVNQEERNSVRCSLSISWCQQSHSQSHNIRHHYQED